MNFSSHNHYLFSILVFVWISLVGSPAFALPQSEQLAQPVEENLVVATPVKLPPISAKDLRKYLSGQKPSWPDETPVTIILFPKKSSELIWLCKDVIKIPPATYRRFLMQKAFRSGINIIEVQNQDEALSILKENSGAISPIGSKYLSEHIHPIVIQ